MKYASLLAFLNGQITSEQFSEEIAPEVEECAASIRATRQGYILAPKGPEIPFTRAQARRLIQAMADKTISLEAACYVADCVIMSHCFDFDEDDETALEAMHFASDDSPPPPTDEMIANVLRSLN